MRFPISSRAWFPALLSLALAPPACTSLGLPGASGRHDLAAGDGDGGVDLGVPDLSGDGGGGDLQPPPDDTDGGNNIGGDGCAALPAKPTRIVGHISQNRHLTCDHLYLMAGLVVVDTGVTLTIDKGTTILMSMDASLIVVQGAKLVAIGTRDQPIVFTSAYLPGSRNPGDWGVVALLGFAPGNWGLDSMGHVQTEHAPQANDWPGGTFPYIAGGSAPNDSSGTLRYVRLEYGGTVRTSDGMADHEMLGLYGVGAGTLIEYVDMRQSNFECLFSEGGTFLARHLVCQWSGNGGFGFSRGNQSKVQFLLDQESPYKAAEGLGIKGPGDRNQLAPLTSPTIYNVTVCGTGMNSTTATLKDPYSLFLNRQPAGHVYDFIGSGFRAGVAMLNANAVAGTELRSAILYGNFDPNTPNTNIGYGSPPNYTDMTVWFNTPGWLNSTQNPGLDDCFDPNRLRAMPTTSLTTNAATPPVDGFFDPSATYIGAFKDTTDQWATGNWIVWSSK